MPIHGDGFEPVQTPHDHTNRRATRPDREPLAAVSIFEVTFPFTAARATLLSDEPVRVTAAEKAAGMGLPDTSAEGWRYSPVADLDLNSLLPVTATPTSSLPKISEYEDHLAGLSVAATVTMINGFITSIDVADGWASKGLVVTAESFTMPPLAEEPNLFDVLHTSFAPDGLLVSVPEGLVIDEPIVIRNHLTAQSAGFSSLTVKVADNAEVMVLEHFTSEAGCLGVPITNFVVGDRATLKHTSVQDLDPSSWQIGRIIGSAGQFGVLSSGLVAFGGKYARVRTDIDLVGRGAKGELVGAYFCDGGQIIDYRTFQHHRANDTISDLLFKGTVDDEAGSIYTGMIHIHPDGAGSNAFQTNRNIKLGEQAWAWSVPNLQIENNEVRCSHASTVSPVDPDQRFYLHSRGVPPIVADRLIVAGFFEEALKRVPIQPAAEMARALISAKLDQRMGIK